MPVFLLYLLSLLLLFPPLLSALTPSPQPSHLLRPSSHSHSLSSSSPQQYLDPTFPSLLLPSTPPTFSLPLFSHSFAYTYNLPPFTSSYSPPSSPWSRAVLHLSVSCAGDQYDRIAAVWLDRVELLRTSTAEPTEAGVFWSVRKEVTRYKSLLNNPPNGTVSVMLENIVDDTFTGVYHVNVSLDFFLSEEDESLESKNPADMIIPIAEEKADTGFWFRIHNGSHMRFTQFGIPSNTFRAVLEIFVSFHGNDEFWYTNPPDSYIKKNNLTTCRGNAAFREVFVTVDGYYAGSIVPFPVVFTGGINPLWWAPVVALGAFNLPTYTLELTPFLGILLDRKSHEIGVGVTDGISFWLIDANLHIWLDPNSDITSAKVVNQVKETSISRDYSSQSLNGTFEIKAGRTSYFSGWVNSSFGNLTTYVSNEIEFNSLVKFTNNGNNKYVLMNTNQNRLVKISSGEQGDGIISQETYESKYPIQVITKTVPGENDTYTLITSLSHSLYEKQHCESGNEVHASYLIDKQEADGWMLAQDHSVLSGSASTWQRYEYGDEDSVYSRVVQVKDGVILSDNVTECSALRHFSW
ncbi:Peptide-N4-(N-acetyl-beta-glucosaminyl)asparagine amidase A [Rhynchospora pubera]|uniref:Peptide-N4-(N-acetyl-beta-glucosaminyl)asparagine amidase A n=1 Tax=Rhynchospora pubera TaxID=906938 RepID=A0AAV8EFN7_9POAL|nr:Peptide-N4-(N-acetyl-beta-glucosaminyl)asparagine amidase A [Rhynchospora pubera]